MRQGQGVGGRGWGWGGGGGGVLDALAEGWVAAARAGTARFRVAWGAAARARARVMIRCGA